MSHDVSTYHIGGCDTWILGSAPISFTWISLHDHTHTHTQTLKSHASQKRRILWDFERVLRYLNQSLSRNAHAEYETSVSPAA